MKYLVMLEIFNRDLCSSWHNGSCVDVRFKADFKTKEEAEYFAEQIILLKYTKESSVGNPTKYTTKKIILPYFSEDIESIKDFFKYSELPDLDSLNEEDED